jgi:hypothetical protein
MPRAALVAASVAFAGALAFAGYELLSLPGRGGGVGEAIVGGGEARRFDEALALFRASVRERAASPAAFGRRARAEAALAGVSGDRRLRSQARTLLGVLVLADAAAQRQRAAELAETAAASFRDALRLDPANEDAAVDLELLLARQRQAARQSGDGERGESGSGEERRPSRGATASSGQGGGY